jgi:hypothetical protein
LDWGWWLGDVRLLLYQQQYADRGQCQHHDQYLPTQLFQYKPFTIKPFTI